MTSKDKTKKIMMFVGVGKNQYLQINIDNIRFFDINKVGIEGIGKPLTNFDKICSVISTTNYKFY